MHTQGPQFSAFVTKRLGPGAPSGAFWRMLSRAFSAPSFPAFWRYWNPAFAYLLRYYCYVPLRHTFSRGVSVVLTFAAGGFLFHDCLVWLVASSLGYRYNFPLVTVAFVLLGLLVLASDRFGLTLQALPVPARVIVHGGAIVCAFALALSAALLFNVLGA